MSHAYTPRLTGQRDRGRIAIVCVALAALAVGGVGGGLLDDRGPGQPARAAAAAQAATPVGAVALAQANLALQAQQLQSVLNAYAMLAQAVPSHEAAHAADVQLRRHEQALADVGRSAARLAWRAGSGTSDLAAGSLAIERAADRLRAAAVAGREAAQSEHDGEHGVQALRAVANDAQRASARLGELLGTLTAARTATAYDAALTALVHEIDGIDPALGSSGGEHRGAALADDPVPAPASP